MAEINEYLHFTGPQRRDKALHELIGMLRGMAADGQIDANEIRELRDWLILHDALTSKCAGFSELAFAVRKAIDDREVSREEMTDLLWLCDRLDSSSEYYGAFTHAIQQLHGMLHGVIANGVIAPEEAALLLSWQEEHEGLRQCWPFTEVETLLVTSIVDGKIRPEAQHTLIYFFSQFANLSTDSPVRKGLDLSAAELTVRGICATDPQIDFPDRTFCFTGISRKASRGECESQVRSKNGHCVSAVSGNLDYLVIMEEGNPCWAYGCYGRKVEEAVHRRRAGQELLLVRERDFWDAVS